MSSPDSITQFEAKGGARPEGRAALVRVGRYELGRRLGQGGAGTVYSARDPELQRDVAVKVITLRSGAHDEAARLVREGQALAQLSHDHVVRVFDVGVHDASTVYLVMEQLGGGDLRRWLAASHGIGEIVDACMAAGRGLAAVHAIGVVHRDFKPSNVLVGSDGQVKVGDFGLAKAFARIDSDAGARSTSGDALHLDDGITGTGSVVGTPAFMAPEQHTGGDVGPAADQFAFCVSFWLALFGRHPFAGDSLRELAANKLAGRIVAPPPRRGIPHDVVVALARGLAAAPDARHPDMDALMTRLAQAFARRRTRGRFLAAGAGTLALLGGIAIVTARPQCDDAAERIDPIWNDAARRDVESALDQARLEVEAPRSLHGIVPQLDAYAQSWVAARNDACAVARTDARGPADDPTMRCLDRRVGAFEDAVALLRESTGATGLYAADIVDALAPVAACDGPDRSDAWADDGERRIAIDDELRRLDQARALAIANRPNEARALADAVAHSSAASDYPPLQPMAAGVLARLDRDIGEAPAAASRLVAAMAIAEEHGLDRLVADTGVVLIAILAHELQQPEEAEFWLRRTELAVARTGRDPQTHSYLQAATAAIHATRFDIPAARDAMLRAVEFSATARERQGHLGLLCSMEASLDQHQAAAGHCAEALALARSRMGEDHPDLAGLLGNHANALYNAGDSRGAAAELEQAIAMVERTHGPTHRLLPKLLGALADAREAIGGVDDSVLAISRRALTLAKEQVGTEHPLFAEEEEQYGRLLAIAGRPADAIEPLTHALRVREAIFGPDHPRLAITLHELGDTLLEAGRAKEAATALRRTHALMQHMPEFEVEDAEVRFCLADALWQSGDRRESLVLARGAMLELARAGEAEISADAYLWLAERER